jgi:hypothetical protein
MDDTSSEPTVKTAARWMLRPAILRAAPVTMSISGQLSLL